TNSTDGGNNGTCWSGFAVSVTFSGTIYKNDENTATTTTGYSVKLSVSGGAAQSVSSGSNGVFSFSVSQPATGSVVSLWLDTNGGSRASLAFKYGNSCSGLPGCTGLKLVDNQVRIENYNSTTTANTDLAACDNDSGAGCSDTDIGFTANSGVLTVSSNWELKI